MTLQEMRDKRKALVDKLASYREDRPDGKGKRNREDLTDDERGECRTIVEQIETHNAEIKDAEEAENLDSRCADIDTVMSTPQPLRSRPTGPSGRPPAGKVPATAIDHNDLPFETFGDQLRAIQVACLPGAVADPRLNESRAMGLSEGIGADGGFLVQTDFAGTLANLIYETALLPGRCTNIPVGPNSNGITMNAINQTSRADGSRWGGVQGYWLGEAGVKTPSDPEWRQIELKLHKLAGLCYATDELLQDTTALEATLAQAFADEFGFLLDDAIINGLGGGMPLGILAGPCLTTVAQEAGQAVGTIIAENVENMYSRMYTGGISNAVWLVNQECFPQLYQLHHAIGTAGVPVFVPPGGISGSPYGAIFGRPVIPIEQTARLGTIGDILFCDFSQYITITKGGTNVASSIESAVSIHVKFVYDETAFRFVMRFDGQPIWNSEITPYAGGPTVGPFIALATRV